MIKDQKVHEITGTCGASCNRADWLSAIKDGMESGDCNPYRLPDDYPAPREILKVHFPKYADQLLFSGGWGYDQKTATVVKTFDPEINPTEHFDGIALENVFIQKRIWEELEYARPEGERMFGSLS